ncbi:ankyrin repeat-containing domain protein [Cercophora newfieldiana]|uniref:Ankyrin repeat-containing domain protein n=1 Tax=Cercophora newfieldiana TaxID=92897 RepID=A0AA40CS91_9PEZI|nr:ankyrin repeat-containing domain protein [Cercophora newfieldiana]
MSCPMEPNGAVCLQAVVRKKCVGYCRCRCHRASSFSTPEIFTNLFGRLCMRYGGLPWIGTSTCDDLSCNTNRGSSFQLDYIFPEWLLRRTLCVAAYWNSMSGISIHLNLPQALPDTHPVWEIILYNDLNRLKKLLAKGEIRPTDTRVTGTPMFSYAKDYEKYEMADFIYSLGIDIYAGPRGTSPVEQAMLWHRTRQHERMSRLPAIAKILSITNIDESYPTLVHEVLRGSRRMTVAEALKIEPWALDTRDMVGFTPLHWAVYMDRPGDVRTLTGLGADIGATDSRGRGLLDHAASYGHLECVVALVDGGCEIESRGGPGSTTWSPLYYAVHACQYETTHFLLSRGASLGSWSAFHRSIYDRCGDDELKLHKIFELLISFGGNPNKRNVGGWAPIHDAVIFNRPGAFKALYKVGAQLDALTPTTGENILHLAATWATLDLIRAMRELQITLNPRTLDKSGRLPLHCLEQSISTPEDERLPGQVKPSEEGITEFKTLLREVEERYDERCRAEGFAEGIVAPEPTPSDCESSGSEHDGNS